MDDRVILFTWEDDDPKTYLRELCISDAAVNEVFVIPTGAFQLTYGSALNKRIFDHQTAQRIKQAANVCAARLSMEAARIARTSERAICADAPIIWTAISRIHALSGQYAQLAERMDATETKCMTIERNSIWRRDLQESYEYLEREIERVSDQLRAIELSGA
jgi:hypothetical protein